jgi:ATP-dependent helicase/nuclease subunit B
LWTPVDHPGQIYEQADTVIWWGFVSERNQVRSIVWTADELKFLAAQNIFPEHPFAHIARETASWRLPLSMAKRVILVKPRTVAGRAVAVHPFFHEFVEFIEKSEPEARAKVIRQAHQIYSQPDTKLAGFHLTRTKMQRANLPTARPIWKVSPNAISHREESATSIEKLLGCPLSWTLRYPAGIHPGIVLSQPGLDLMAGNLAHAVFARLFAGGLDNAALEAKDGIVGRAEAAFDELCPKVAGPLLLPGNSLERSRLKRSISEAAAHLAGIVSDASFTSIECESEQRAQLGEMKLFGRPDMILVDDDGTDVVLDLKLARRASFRRRELSEGRAIQLSLYSWLRSFQTQRSSMAGYYMIAQKQLLLSEVGSFPPHMHVKGPALAETLANVVTTYSEHLRKLVGGTVYATGICDDVVELTPEQRFNRISDEELKQPALKIDGISFVIEPPCKFCQYGKLCGKREFAK